MLANPPTSNYATCAGFELHYYEWGAADAPAVMLWHGLARTGKDFDPLARALADRYRLIAPDTIGRGFSQWARDADTDYTFKTYGAIANSLCDQLGIDQVRWVGTSMGGSLGMYLAGGEMSERISHLVVNDIGPEITKVSQDRIATYVGSPPTFETASELEAYLREIYVPFGHIPDPQWREMMESSFRRLPNGKVTTHYDPTIVRQFQGTSNDFHLWDRYDRITCPTLLLRGVNSDLLTEEMITKMTTRGPDLSVHRCEGCGHAPSLNVPEQIAPVETFLAQ
jgi:pimeloyl-ACP methyl ester carboxylesterase